MRIVTEAPNSSAETWSSKPWNAPTTRPSEIASFVDPRQRVYIPGHPNYANRQQHNASASLLPLRFFSPKRLRNSKSVDRR